jgi:hydroxylamine reductase (hybrid-cluster protein)
MAETAPIQDTLMYMVKTVSFWCSAARHASASAEDLQAVNAWTLQAMFATLTDVKFSKDNALPNSFDKVWQLRIIR